MLVNMIKSEIEDATITSAHMDYVGSITIDSDVMKAAEILPGEKVRVVKIKTGEFFEMHTQVGAAKSGILGLNGASTKLIQPGEKVKIISYCWLEKKEASSFSPDVS